MNRNSRIFLKVLLIFLLIAGFLFLMKKDTKIFRMEQPKGEGITIEEVKILMQAFGEKASCSMEIQDGLSDYLAQMEEKYGIKEQFLYGDYIEMMGLFTDIPGVMGNKYREEFYLLKEDWYQSYDKLLEQYGLKETIRKTEVFLLAGGENLTGDKPDGDCVLSAEGKIFTCKSDEFEDCYFSGVTAYAEEDSLLTVVKKQKGSVILKNVWVMEKEENKIRFFIHGFEVCYGFKENDPASGALRESVADMTFAKGQMTGIDSRTEKTGGKLLKVGEGELELQDEGTFKLTEECRVYRLYEELCETGTEDLRIGYDFADYVLDKGKICAILITRKENMENIRVAVLNNGFKSLYHEEIVLAADCQVELLYGPYGNREKEVVPAGEEIRIGKESRYLKGDRIQVVPDLKSGRIEARSLERNQGMPSYRGSMEIVATENGLVLINELLLEEYLYSVVPSEMPASYNGEALKAQAVCARTYAYRYLITPGLPDIGAHVDDSVNYQVYNNIAENVNSTKAVKETAGTLLFYEDEAVSAYYYSTSCGFGTDAGIWNEDNKERFSYLTSLHIAREDEDASMPEKMQEEEFFRNYILNVGESDYEKEEAWYRWEYRAESLNMEEMTSRLGQDFHEIYEIAITERREGGAADKLIVETDTGTFEVTGEYNIRYTLNNGGKITRQDGTETEPGNLLPSAYIVIDVVKNEENVIGYTIFGGGYGHGVGMSQNGAKAMGNMGKSCMEILTFFYPGCRMEKMY